MMLVLVKAKAMPLLMMLMVLMVVHFQSMFFSSFCSSCPSSWPSFGSEKYYLLPLQRKKCRGLIEPISFSCSVWTLFWCVCVLVQISTKRAQARHFITITTTITVMNRVIIGTRAVSRTTTAPRQLPPSSLILYKHAHPALQQRQYSGRDTRGGTKDICMYYMRCTI